MKRKIYIALGTLATLGILCVLVLCVFGYLLTHRVEGSYFDSNGVRIHYVVEGKGEPVILVHGVAANADLNWRRPGVIRALSRDFQVISFDLRGHGLSDKPTDPAAYGREMIEDVTRLMDHLKIEKAHVAGYSLGGFITLKFVATHPDRVLSAAICAAGWKDADDPAPIPNPYSQPPKMGEELRPVQSQASIFPGSGSAKSLFGRVRGWVGDQLMNPIAEKALKKSLRAFAVSQAELDATKVPTVCYIGTNDGFLNLARDLKKHMPSVDLVELEGATHFSMPFYGDFKRGLDAFFKTGPSTAKQ
jgi:pimeloyl-ACP methyl ester carboxylesterase